jgi:hypothetical protein
VAAHFTATLTSLREQGTRATVEALVRVARSRRAR